MPQQVTFLGGDMHGKVATLEDDRAVVRVPILAFADLARPIPIDEYVVPTVSELRTETYRVHRIHIDRHIRRVAVRDCDLHDADALVHAYLLELFDAAAASVRRS